MNIKAGVRLFVGLPLFDIFRKKAKKSIKQTEFIS